MESQPMPREDAPTIVVYSKTPCVQCNGVKRHLTKEDADFTVEDLTIKGDPETPENLDRQNKLDALKALGYTGVPVTMVNDEHFYGYQPDKLDDAIARQRRAKMHLVEGAVA
ncbi:NrdH-like glutaredoxin [Arthrobacter phage Vibaki]|uniref:NrdH-like glutaredoxin n=1 Tax=Arthrobacter phage Vibaki TaxID=2593333 RepID=A0A514TZ46_9CAUD|nr:NrdH-like glutaredoxin [Arthrobacter phage Vibaki]QDK01920.1 NrdH-like glutaredoxin [Arthrobacter phage Vibaki]